MLVESVQQAKWNYELDAWQGPVYGSEGVEGNASVGERGNGGGVDEEKTN